MAFLRRCSCACSSPSPSGCRAGGSMRRPQRVRRCSHPRAGGDVLLFVQLVIAATMRHNYAASPFPPSRSRPKAGSCRRPGTSHRDPFCPSSDGLGPHDRVGRPRRRHLAFRCLGRTQACRRRDVRLLVLQIALGAAAIWTMRNPYYTTAHVIVGACLLASVFTLTWWTYRGSIDRAATAMPMRVQPRPAVLERA